MHIKTKKLTFLGLLLALAILFQLIGVYMESSTLFFLAVSSFCLGIAIYETSLALGACFLVSAAALSFILSPNKFYCFTYSAFCIYIYLLEVVRKKTHLEEHMFFLWALKFLFYNAAFLAPVLLFFRTFLFTGGITWNIWVYLGVIAAAQAFLVIFDLAYQRCVPAYWIQLKKRLRLDI